MKTTISKALKRIMNDNGYGPLTENSKNQLIEDLEHDLFLMVPDFGEDDPDVKNYRQAVKELKNLKL